jgi:hypothetical protein
VGSSDTALVIGAERGIVALGGTSSELADAVWDEDLADHVSSGTFGERLGKLPLIGKMIAMLKDL